MSLVEKINKLPRELLLGGLSLALVGCSNEPTIDPNWSIEEDDKIATLYISENRENETDGFPSELTYFVKNKMKRQPICYKFEITEGTEYEPMFAGGFFKVESDSVRKIGTVKVLDGESFEIVYDRAYTTNMNKCQN